MIRLLLLVLALLLPSTLALAGGADDDDDSAADDDDDDDDDSIDDGSDVPLENRVLGGGCDGDVPSGPYAALPFAGLALGASLVRRRRE